MPLPAATMPSTTALSHVGDLFQILRDGLPRTRAELAASTGLARSTVAARIDVLLASGLIATVGDAASSGGRPPSRIAVNPSARIVLAFDIGASHCVVAVTDLASTVIDSSTFDMDIAAGPEVVLDRALTAARSLIAAHPQLSGIELAGIGIGLPGPVEHDSGRPINPPIMPGWDGFDVVDYVQSRFNCPVFVDNDVNIMALGERSTHWPGQDNLLFVKVSTGIGVGIISSGLLQRGAVGAAGDIGHVRVADANDVVCVCGNTGCLEALVGGPAITARLQADGVSAQNVREVVELARARNPKAIAVIRQAGREIGTVLATCVNLLNPSIIVIGGGLALADEHLLAGIREIVYQRSLPLSTANLQIVSSRAMDTAGILGASSLVIGQVMSAEAIESHLLHRTA
ncbi:ROK family transcriptional regulator [Cryobacterium frigoriphilum]|uniref:ROK family transcriptional regulator n=1 Tax=Cryobacterium frigoriphilum TaxID=1259150 RepID=A0A4R9A1F9_9MICO|nr:ROK family protein [Cryobacterium frigoriphilum]TFD50251.1 ROK family transcriptional regulator [Cryobacterium frigoriphilum]